MELDIFFVFTSILLGLGLAVDAFSVSIADGLNEPGMKRSRMCLIAGTYGFFQFAMPMVGWICVHTITAYFRAFQKVIPWIALILLLLIGGKMLLDGIRQRADAREQQEEEKIAEEIREGKMGPGELILQGIATSIDALSVGFTISEYGAGMALLCSLIIAVVTFVICMAGLLFGKKFGERFSDQASILGGCILIVIGITIFVRVL